MNWTRERFADQLDLLEEDVEVCEQESSPSYDCLGTLEVNLSVATRHQDLADEAMKGRFLNLQERALRILQRQVWSHR